MIQGFLGVILPALPLQRGLDPLSLFISVVAVGMWAERLRCPSEASYPQLSLRHCLDRRRHARRSSGFGWLGLGKGVGHWGESSTHRSRPGPCSRRHSPSNGPSYLSERHSLSIKMLFMERPRPPMENARPADSRLPANSARVNCAPWSALKMRGFPCRTRASFSASTQERERGYPTIARNEPPGSFWGL